MKLLPLLFTIVVLICCNDMPSSIAVNNNEAVYDYTCPEEQVTASENWEKVFDIPLPSGFHLFKSFCFSKVQMEPLFIHPTVCEQFLMAVS